MFIDDLRQAWLCRNTKVLYHIKDTSEYLMTNDSGNELEMLRVFSADKNGKMYMEGYLLGSIFAHDPDIIPELEDVNCTFEELCPDHFNARPVTNGLIGLSVGDAFGVPYEFMSRADVKRAAINSPFGNMVGVNDNLPFISRWTYLIPRGAWSDDTSMTIAAMASIVNNGGRIDHDDIMRQFIEWWDKGTYSSQRYAFGLGGNIGAALKRFRSGTPAVECGGTGFRDNGNGALMRIFPFSMYCILRNLDDKATFDIIKKASSLTHAHEISVFCCYLYTQFLFECYRTKNPQMAYQNAVYNKRLDYKNAFSEETITALDAVLNKVGSDDFDPLTIPESGYVADSLTAALYCILHTDNYEDAIKTAVLLGYDTDTNAAITGSVAGVLYGMDSIPERWLNTLVKKDELLSLAERFEECISR